MTYRSLLLAGPLLLVACSAADSSLQKINANYEVSIEIGACQTMTFLNSLPDPTSVAYAFTDADGAERSTGSVGPIGAGSTAGLAVKDQGAILVLSPTPDVVAQQTDPCSIELTAAEPTACDCAEGYVCDATTGACNQACADDSDCAAGSICDATAQWCIPAS